MTQRPSPLFAPAKSGRHLNEGRHVVDSVTPFPSISGNQVYEKLYSQICSTDQTSAMR